MGIPASGFSSSFRNNADDVAKMLYKYHGDHFMIFNLSEKEYKYELFQNNVVDLGWPDHHGPPLEILFQCIDAMASWIHSDSANVAVVHCKAGKVVVLFYLKFSVGTNWYCNSVIFTL